VALAKCSECSPVAELVPDNKRRKNHNGANT
jgi:hypothetical protein